jgi:hypothetical protein
MPPAAPPTALHCRQSSTILGAPHPECRRGLTAAAPTPESDHPFVAAAFLVRAIDDRAAERRARESDHPLSLHALTARRFPLTADRSRRPKPSS